MNPDSAPTSMISVAAGALIMINLIGLVGLIGLLGSGATGLY